VESDEPTIEEYPIEKEYCEYMFTVGKPVGEAVLKCRPVGNVVGNPVGNVVGNPVGTRNKEATETVESEVPTADEYPIE